MSCSTAPVRGVRFESEARPPLHSEESVAVPSMVCRQLGLLRVLHACVNSPQYSLLSNTSKWRG